jgi:hypothetical protein
MLAWDVLTAAVYCQILHRLSTKHCPTNRSHVIARVIARVITPSTASRLLPQG